jgi:hypothetical protein
MASIDIVPAEAGHVGAIAARMRPADRDEAWAAARLTPEAALLLSLSVSPLAWTGRVDGRPECMFGAGNGGVPWLLGTDAVERHALAFLRSNPAYVARMQARFGRLSNWVDARNATSIRWLRWLGFTIGEPRPYGPLGLPFHPFWMSPGDPVKGKVDGISKT